MIFKSYSITGRTFCIIMASLIISCSPDSDLNSKNSTEISSIAKLNKANLAEATRLYNEMSASSEYMQWKESLALFNAKLGNNKVLCESRLEYMTWISNNIQRTNFVNVQQFEAILTDVYTKYVLMKSRNTALYSFLQDADFDDLAVILEIETPEPAPESKVLCYGICSMQYDMASFNNSQWLNGMLGEAYASGNDWGELSIFSGYLYMQAGTNATYAGCMAGC